MSIQIKFVRLVNFIKTCVFDLFQNFIYIYINELRLSIFAPYSDCFPGFDLCMYKTY
jgi:hypothetical protein